MKLIVRTALICLAPIALLALVIMANAMDGVR